jgi:hypothetical protein
MKPLVLAAAFLVSSLTLAACATDPGYGPAATASASGYSEQMISKDRWRVNYRGTTRMTSADVQDHALMRAAEVTLQQGGQSFEIVDSDTDADAKRRYSTETRYEPDIGFARQCGLLGCTTRAVPVMTRTERETVEERTVYEHSMEIVISNGAKQTQSSRTYDARDTFQTLKSRLG